MRDMMGETALGFCEQKFEQGVHICQIFSDDAERRDALLKFVLAGMQANEDTACFSERETSASVGEYLKHYGIDAEEKFADGRLRMATTRQAYFQGNRFDPEVMLAQLKEFFGDACAHSSSGARAIGEMIPEVQGLEGGERLLEYEAKVSLLQKEYPITAICQYDARLFDGATLLEVLKVHPFMIVRGAVVRNPFYLPPEEYLKEAPCSKPACSAICC